MFKAYAQVGNDHHKRPKNDTNELLTILSWMLAYMVTRKLTLRNIIRS